MLMPSQPSQPSRQEKLRSVTILPTSRNTLTLHPDKRHPQSHGSLSMISKLCTSATSTPEADISWCISMIILSQVAWTALDVSLARS